MKYLKLFFQARRSFPPGVPGRLVIGLVGVEREKEHEHVPDIVSISFQATQRKLEPVTKTNVSSRHSMGQIFIIFSGPPEFSPWGSWSSCDRTCGGGKKKRTRTCTKYCDDLISSDTVQAQAFNENECGPCSSLKSQCDIGNRVYTPPAALTPNIGLCQIDGNTKKVSSIYSFRIFGIINVQTY